MRAHFPNLHAFCLLQTACSCCISLALQGQPKVSLQHVIFKDKVLATNLAAFIDQTKAEVAGVVMEKRDSAYLYKLYKIYQLDEVQHYPTRSWGQWKNKIIVFRAGPELSEACIISDTSSYSNLLNYIRPRLIEGGPGLIIEGLEWVFKVKKGREEWLYNNEGYDSRDIVEPK